MAHFRYYFHHKVKVLKTIDGKLVPEVQTKEVVFYGYRELDARGQFLETYGYEPGDLVRRENW